MYLELLIEKLQRDADNELFTDINFPYPLEVSILF